MDLIIAPSKLPFYYENNSYKIINAGIKNNIAYAAVEPENDKLVQKLIKRIGNDKGLTVYLGFDYICFTEDYPQKIIKT